jgi:hypothetical protein
MMPAEAVVEALIPELLSTAQELLAIAEQSADECSFEEGDELAFEDPLSPDEMRSFLDKYSETENKRFRSII